MFGGIIHGPKMEVTVKIQEPALIGSSSSLLSSAFDAVGRFLSTKFLPNHWVEIQSTLLAGRAVQSASVAPEIFTPHSSPAERMFDVVTQRAEKHEGRAEKHGVCIDARHEVSWVPNTSVEDALLSSPTEKKVESMCLRTFPFEVNSVPNASVDDAPLSSLPQRGCLMS